MRASHCVQGKAEGGMKRMRIVLRVVLGVLLLVAAASAQEDKNARPDLAKLFERKEVMIPMRDGVKLHTEIYTPREANGQLPFLMKRTPYGISSGPGQYSRELYGDRHLYADQYIFVYQDIRGRYGSGGDFQMNRAVHDPSDPKGVDESTDTYDTIEWLVKNVPNNNGRVGIHGVSYDGFADHHGADSSAPGAEGGVRTGVPGDMPGWATISFTTGRFG